MAMLDNWMIRQYQLSLIINNIIKVGSIQFASSCHFRAFKNSQLVPVTCQYIKFGNIKKVFISKKCKLNVAKRFRFFMYGHTKLKNSTVSYHKALDHKTVFLYKFITMKALPCALYILQHVKKILLIFFFNVTLPWIFYEY